MLLDVLRGIAVLSVMALHNGTHGMGRNSPWLEDTVWRVLAHGYLGVQLFFVISGYCIQGAVDSAARSSQPLRKFAIRRLRRIYPPYWCSLIFTIVLAFGTMLVMRKSWDSIFPLSLRDWILNVFLLQGPFGAPDAALVYWSLTIEVQFYVLMAMALMWGRWSPLWLITLSLLYLVWVISPSVGITGTALAYWPEFASGIAAYHAVHHGNRGRWTAAALWVLTATSALVGISHGVALLGAEGEFATPYKQLFCLCCGLALWFALSRSSTIVCRGPMRILAAVGTISYSLYLTHVPIGSRVFNLAGRLIDLDHGGWIPVMVVAWMLQWLGGYLFFKWCEQPWLNRQSDRSRAGVECPRQGAALPLQPEPAQ